MTRRLWDDYLTDRDREVFRQSGFGATAGFGERPALMIIDVSYGFAGDRPEPILQSIKRWSNSCGAESWDAIAVIADLADAFRAKELPVLYTTGEIRPDGWDIGSWAWKNGRTGEQTRPPAGMDPNQIVPALAPQPRDIVVTKQKPSAFFGTPMSSYLNLLGCDSIVVTGTTTSGCVRASVIDAFSENYRLTVVEDGCFDRSQASHAINLCDMHAKYADVVPATEVLSYVDGLPEGLFAGRLP
ncbi:MAG: isochorismatase family protein, partial [Alphaproteobacteria bacterium]|nr:isochorismatase family protein [Alphaproteobacteria bacterium]